MTTAKEERAQRRKARNQQWKEFCLSLIEQDVAKYGHIICWWCGEYGTIDIPDDFNAVWGHHIDGNRNNCTLDNCYIAHHRCQTVDIHPKHIDVRIYPNKKAWLERLVEE